MSEIRAIVPDTGSLKPRPRWRRNPLSRFVVLATFMFAFMMAGMLLWPGEASVDWQQTLIISIALSLALVSGTVVAERRYGREALSDDQHPKARAAMWTEIGVCALVAAVAIVLLKGFLQ